MKRPCQDCPFLIGSLFENSMCVARAHEIAESLRAGGFFPCHKTTDASGAEPGQEKFCAGALATMQNEGVVMENQMVRICARLGMIGDPAQLDGLDECYGSLLQWVESHSLETAREGAKKPPGRATRRGKPGGRKSTPKRESAGS